ncbi:MAG: efflux transporter periplasmic adaptor subunit [Thalassobius sp.]|nr:efflux transporter periplasmic adaptor subunit [Thalassovita sp.]
MKNRCLYILPFLLSVIFVSCNSKDESNKTKEYPVLELSSKEITGYKNFPARIEGTVDIEVRPKIAGFLEQIYVDEGQYVHRNQKLFKLEARSLQGEVEAAASSIEVAKANVATSEVEVEKLLPLVQDSIISSVRLKSAQAELTAARSELDKAISSYQGVKENINYQYVYSAVDGIVGSIPYRQGTLVGSEQSMPLTTVSKTDSVYAYFSMNEKEYLSFLRSTKGDNLYEKIRNFPHVKLTLADGSEYEMEGIIQTTTGQIDQQTGTATFRAVFPNPNLLLNSGNSGIIKIPKKLEDIVLVPSQAITEEQSKYYAYKLDKGDTIRRVLIKSSEQIDNLFVVSDGLNASDKILVSGLNQIANNEKIKPRLVSFDSLSNSVKQVF